MIYGQSPLPVSIKKINLKIWKLRDELEWIIQNRLIEAQGDMKKLDLTDLKEIYQKHLPPLDEVPPQKPAHRGPSAKEKILRLKRSRPQLPQEQFCNGVVALMDLNMETLSCFCNHRFLKGQTVVVEFLIPQHFFVTGEVMECRPYNKKNQVISLHHSPIRLHLRWTYLLSGERSRLRKFLQSIAPEIAAQEQEA